MTAMTASSGSSRDVHELLRSPRLRARLRIAIAAEIVATYVEVRWRLLGGNIRGAVTALRRGAVDEHEPLDAGRLGKRLGSPVSRTLDPLPWDSRCLMRSLVLLRMLARRGVVCRLVIGVRSGDAFEAHAWIEHEGRPLLPTLGFHPLTVL